LSRIEVAGAPCDGRPALVDWTVLSRRVFLGLCAATGGSMSPCVAEADEARAGPEGVDQDLRWSELRVAGPDAILRQALILVPAQGPPGQRYPALLLFHGRGEAGDPHAGMHAWRVPYGLASADAQLRRAPLEADAERTRFMSPSQLDELQARLAQQPFRGLVLICPVTPRPHAGANPERSLDAYAEWIEQSLLPRVEALAPVAQTACLGVDGCSMGGQVAAEVFARKPHLFRTFGLVQPALDQARLPSLAQQLATTARRPGFAGIHLETSSEDPYRRRTEALGRQLRQLGTRHTLDVLPGPHTQGWLRASGTLMMLAWHERLLQMEMSAIEIAEAELRSTRELRVQDR
jgi:hypothetical protein